MLKKSIRIDKSVQIPLKTSDLPFEDMEIGDSFLFPKEIKYSCSMVSNANTKYAAAGKRFTHRKLTDGARCWRTA